MNSTWAEQAAWTRSQRQAASSCGALRMATTSQRSPKSKVGHAEFAKARSLPAFAEPLEPGLQEVTGGMMLQTALKGPRPAMLQSAESGASGRPPSSDTSRTSQSHFGNNGASSSMQVRAQFHEPAMRGLSSPSTPAGLNRNAFFPPSWRGGVVRKKGGGLKPAPAFPKLSLSKLSFRLLRQLE